MVKAFISGASRGSGLPFMLRSMQPLMRSSTVLILVHAPAVLREGRRHADLGKV